MPDDASEMHSLLGTSVRSRYSMCPELYAQYGYQHQHD